MFGVREVVIYDMKASLVYVLELAFIDFLIFFG